MKYKINYCNILTGGKSQKTINQLDILFKKVSSELVNNNISIIPFYGTLLGIVRENNFIKNDDDVDILIDYKYYDFCKKIILDRGFKIIEDAKNNTIQVIENKDDKYDIYYYTYESDYVYIKVHDQKIHKKYIFPLKEIFFKNVKVNLPNDSEKILKFLYGNDWKIPQSKKSPFHTELHGGVLFSSNTYITSNDVKPNIKNFHVLWEYELNNKEGIDRLSVCIPSLQYFNPDKIIYIYSTKLTYEFLSKLNIFNVIIVRWELNEIKKDTPFEEFLINMNVSCIKNPIQISKSSNWVLQHLADIFRLCVIYKFGGSYSDVDNIFIKKMSDDKNLISRTYDPHSFHQKNYLLIDGALREENKDYNHIKFRARNDPIFNFEPNDSYILDVINMGLSKYSYDFIDGYKVISNRIMNNNAWQNIMTNVYLEDLNKNKTRVKFVLLLNYLPDGKGVYRYDDYGKCIHGGEMCDILLKYISLTDGQNVGNFTTSDKSISENILNDLYDKFPYGCLFWAQDHYHFDNSKPQKISNWIVNFIKNKINLSKGGAKIKTHHLKLELFSNEYNKFMTNAFNELKNFHKFAKDNNISYSLRGGNALSYFMINKLMWIWDDDIDISVKESDYNKLRDTMMNGTRFEINDKYFKYASKITINGREFILSESKSMEPIKWFKFATESQIKPYPNNFPGLDIFIVPSDYSLSKQFYPIHFKNLKEIEIDGIKTYIDESPEHLQHMINYYGDMSGWGKHTELLSEDQKQLKEINIKKLLKLLATK